MKNRPRRHRGLVGAARALPPPLLDAPRLGPVTPRAPKSLRPPELFQIRPTRLLGRESALEFGQISRIILHHLVRYILGLPESSKYLVQPIFVLVWVGSVVALVTSAVLGFGQLDGAGRLLIIFAALAYLFGVQLSTFTINVPLNNKLQTLDVDAMNETTRATARKDFEPRWSRWNSFRTVFASLVPWIFDSFNKSMVIWSHRGPEWSAVRTASPSRECRRRSSSM